MRTKTVPYDDAIRAEYTRLFNEAAIRPERVAEVDRTVVRILGRANMVRYGQVEAATRVPAHVIAIIHSLECGSNFAQHLHNGDKLTARTVHVPAGRPASGSPPFEWSESAVDALLLKGLDKWKDWTPAGIAYVLERYNGFGYRLYHPTVLTPYLWSYTTVYTVGRYVADGEFSYSAPSKQCGGMALLKRMTQLGLVAMPGAATAVDAPPAAARQPDPIVEKMRAVQDELRTAGFDPGPSDGWPGDGTYASMKAYRASRGV